MMHTLFSKLIREPRDETPLRVTQNLSEIEVKFLANRSELESRIDLSSCPRELIYQVYLNRSCLEWAKRFVLDRDSTISRNDLKDAHQVRVRHSMLENGTDCFYLALKTRKEHKEGRRKVARLEIPTKITERDFIEISEKRGEGAVSKLRLTHFAGRLPRSKSEVFAEIDIVLDAGPRIAKPSRMLLLEKNLPVGKLGNNLLVECEVEEVGHLNELHIGETPLEFLTGCAVDLSDKLLSELAKPLSSSRLAKKGINYFEVGSALRRFALKLAEAA